MEHQPCPSVLPIAKSKRIWSGIKIKELKISHFPLKDPRDYQILFLTVFLVLGVINRDWSFQLNLIPLSLGSCLLSQWLLGTIIPYISKQEKINQPLSLVTIYSWRSAIITGLGLCLLLRSNNYQTMVLAACLAIASKFIVRFRGKHFFNPANLGIIAALILTNDAWVSPGQWGADWWYLLLFLGTGGIILKKVGRWDTTAAFLLTYAGLEAIRNLYLGWTWDVWQHQLMSGSLLVFAFFMITDPRSIPNATLGRICWAITIALVAFIFHHQFQVYTGVFWALFLLSPLTIWLDNLWVSPRFNWSFKLAN